MALAQGQAAPLQQAKIYTIPAGHSFADALADWLYRQTSGDMLELSNMLVFVPNRRAVKATREAFLRVTEGKATVLPNIRPIGEVDETELSLAAGVDEMGDFTDAFRPAVEGVRRQALLSRMVAAWSQAKGNSIPLAQAWRLAQNLAAFMDQCDIAGVPYSALENLVEDDLAAHWGITLSFLKIVTKNWPELMNELGLINPAERRNLLVRAMVDSWADRPPRGRVVVAGSTGSVPASRELMRAVLGMEQGTIILPNLDLVSDQDEWDAVAPNHPQAMMKGTLVFLDVDRAQVSYLGAYEPHSRSELLRRSMTPSMFTHRWATNAGDASEGLRGLSLLVAPTRRQEAAGIATMVREALTVKGKTVALVTPDRKLARHVKAALQRWKIDVEDSAGIDLVLTPPAVFLQRILDVLREGFAPVQLLALLQHPLCAVSNRGYFLSLVRQLDKKVLRGVRPAAGIGGIEAAVQSAKGMRATHVADFLTLLHIMAPLEQMAAKESFSYRDGVSVLLQVAEALVGFSGGASASTMLWMGENGRALSDHLRGTLNCADDFPLIPAKEFPDFMASLLEGGSVRPQWGRHPRVFIWGALEARLQQADLMILGGLNEGTWPADAGVDPWMSRPMREKFGLPPLEVRVGQAAHDFVTAASAPEVVLTRAEKVDGSPTVPSRWLFRLEACAGRTIPRKGDHEKWSVEMDRAAHVEPETAPAPKPPVEVRPDSLFVTDVELWMRDPYALYAKRILNLRKLDKVDDKPNAAHKGTLIHEALEKYLSDSSNPKHGDAAKTRLIEIGREVFANVISQPAVYAFWWPRFVNLADWFVDFMMDRASTHEVVAIEVQAEAQVPGTDFKLLARADRIDRNLASKCYEIIDYKTGTPPGDTQVRAGFAPQLPLEGWLVQQGAFKEIPAGAVEALAFWKLSGGKKVAEITNLGKNLNIAEVIAEAIEGLTGLIHHFSREETPYLSNPRPDEAGWGDYNQLARVHEWRTRVSGE